VFCYLQPRNAQAFAVDKLQDKDSLIEALLQERDEMYQELSKLREIDNGSLEQAEKKNERYEALLEEKDDKINKLIDQLSWYRRKFWKSSSEKYIPEDPNQCKIDFDGLDVLPEEEEVIKDAEKEIITYEREKPNTKKQPVRLPLPDHLRREEETIEPEGIDESWVRIGEEVTEVLEHKPGELFVRRIVRPKYVLKTDTTQEEDREESTEKIKIGALPMLPLPRSNAGPSLLAELLISKYMHHLPFHRQLAIFKQSGVSIPASTVNGWFKGSSDLLRALYHRLREIVMETDYLQVDETTVPVIDNKKQRAAKSYLWVVRSVIDNLLFFHYDQGSRAQRVVIDLLRDYQGAVQTDGYEVYRIYEQKKGVLLLGCWAHARRKFTEALKEDKAGAEYALKQIGLIYKVEDMATDQNMNYEQRAELRKRLAYPILRAFEKWLEQYYPKVLPKGRMSKAISYTYNIFHRLSRYHLDGRYQIDNNGVENAIRPLALGRKNFLFCGNHDAAENTAMMYSLLGCCKALDVNPREWLIDVLSRIPEYNNDYSMDLAELLPHRWKAPENLQKTTE
jgi:transposase